MALAHNNGSLNVKDAETAFRTVASINGEEVRRLSDGETGARNNWIMALPPRLREAESLEEVRGTAETYIPWPRFRPRGADVSGLRFDLGFVPFARDSYATFQRLREEGVIAPSQRFLVTFPTTSAALAPFIVAEDRLTMEPVWEANLHREVEAVSRTVAHEDLAIQWDVAIEVGLLEGVAFERYFEPVFEGVVERLARHGSWVPEDVELGYHLCYGDAPAGEDVGNGESHHFVEPQDLGRLVELANALTDAVPRPIHWLSMPVPISRDDDAYFRPLDDLRLAPVTELYLGLVHHEDGVEGAARRTASARRHCESFGVGTECGMGRKTPEQVRRLLEIQHRLRL
jgi:hypothetical protein